MRTLGLHFACVLSVVSAIALLVPACGSDSDATGCNDPNRAPVTEYSQPFGTPCCDDDECATQSCDDFGAQGSLCSLFCGGDQDCIGLGDGTCNASHFCEVSM
ncbi:MAG TPA: hypothetical protein VGM56_12520 [Byssovorax sp.]|jgi:hypothetical protein